MVDYKMKMKKGITFIRKPTNTMKIIFEQLTSFISTVQFVEGGPSLDWLCVEPTVCLPFS